VESYDRAIDSEIDRVYACAESARRQGLDPETTPEIPRAQDMAMRVEKLLVHLHLDGIAEEIRDLCRRMPREEVAVAISRRLANDPARGADLESRLDAALRVGLAVLTEGILVAPLEGLAEVHLRPGRNGPYVELYYAGPIRAAGGTAQALSVLLADVIRRDLGLAAYEPTDLEVGRYQEEIPLYKHLQHLQYVPSAAEVEAVVRNVPVCISGESTEGDAEVSAFRNIPRVPTNGVRGGACLVIAEGLCQKATKLRKVVEKLGVPGWEFLGELGHHGPTDAASEGPPKYLREALGGRPVLAYPGRAGGFRLVYGRSRTTGLASLAVNPATMVILREFVAVGTQLKIEYPGKASAMALCDTIEGPIVELLDGTLTSVNEAARATDLLPSVRRIVDLGEILVPFGEFLENNRALVPGSYSLPWHLEELAEAGAPRGSRSFQPTYAEAVEDASRYGVPLHPRFLLFWHDLTPGSVTELSAWVESEGRIVEGGLDLPWAPERREHLVWLGALHGPTADGRLRVEPVSTDALLGGLGLTAVGTRVERTVSVDRPETDVLALVSRLSGCAVRARAPSRVGARVGRPEKARQRSMSPNVHVLFPVGAGGGTHRSVPEAARRTVNEPALTLLGLRLCPACARSSVWMRCSCGAHTEPTGKVVQQPLPVAALWADAVQRLGIRRNLEVKGVKGLTSRGKVPEMLEKGLLRARHGISVYQDGTARFDLTDLPLTHFRPREIGLSLEKAKELGYTTDWSGAPLDSLDQLVELLPQDLVVSRSCGAYLWELSKFVDDELVALYNLEPFYRAARADDLIGALVIALAPHTSGGVTGRIIGYTEAEACFAHPVFHAAKRRNCDGDEDSVTLVLDGLLNFSRSYLPETRGALMDKPLVLTTRLDATEVDKEAHNVDIVARYPLALYRAAAAGLSAKEVDRQVETLGKRLASVDPMAGVAFTHDTTDIAGGPVRSAYRQSESMERIVEQSLVLTSQIRAVDVADAVTLVLNAHFIPDLMGNLKSYATQKFRCKVCNTSYRRPPLSGRCSTTVARGAPCGGALTPTVFEGAVRKYLGLSQRLAATPGVTPYVRQRVQLLESSLATLFPGTPQQATLDRFEAAKGSPAVEEPGRDKAHIERAASGPTAGL
jgi:DNA polymerase II large subunit